jgi:hypothetical protein
MLNFRKKTPKRELPDKNLFTIYNPHSRDVNQRSWTQGYYQVVSVDPAVNNMGFRIERRYRDGRIVPLAYTRQNFYVAPPVDAEGKPMVEAGMVYETYELVTRFLDEFTSMFQESHIFIIERQMPQNYKAVRFSQHIITYFTLRLKDAPLLPLIVEVDNKLKSRQMGAPRGIGERQVKTWLIEKAKELLAMREDTWSLNLLTKERKRDDLADVVCQIEAFFSYMGLPTTVPASSIPKPTVLNIVPVPPPSSITAKDLPTPGTSGPDQETPAIPGELSVQIPVESAKPKGRRRGTKKA